MTTAPVFRSGNKTHTLRSYSFMFGNLEIGESCQFVRISPDSGAIDDPIIEVFRVRGNKYIILLLFIPFHRPPLYTIAVAKIGKTIVFFVGLYSG